MEHDDDVNRSALAMNINSSALAMNVSSNALARIINSNALAIDWEVLVNSHPHAHLRTDLLQCQLELTAHVKGTESDKGRGWVGVGV